MHHTVKQTAPVSRGQEETIAAAIYGTIITAATMTVVSEKRWDEPISTSGQVLFTVAVFWLAHSFAQGMAVRATADGAAPRRFTRDLRSTWPMMAAALPQLAPMALVGIDAFSYDTGLWISYGLAVATVASWGVEIGHRRRLGPPATLRLAAASGLLGLVLITLKEIIH